VANRTKFTNTFVEKVVPQPKQQLFWDSELRCLGLRVGLRKKAFFVRKEYAGKPIEGTLGEFPVMTVEQARIKAMPLLAKIAQGIDPFAEQAEARREATAAAAQDWQTFTLQDAIHEHQARMRSKHTVQRSIDDQQRIAERYVKDWLDRPICQISRKDCIERHRKVTEKHGEYAANGLMRMMRAAWNSTDKLFEELPGKNPVMGVQFNRESRRQEPIPWADLPAWRLKIMADTNRERRRGQLITLLTGLRKSGICNMQWDRLNFMDGTLFVPKEEGGKSREFTLPLSRIVIRLLQRQRRAVPANCPYVFPTIGRVDGAVKPIDQLVSEGVPSAHRLRDTYTTAAHAAGVDEITIEVLTNHRKPKGTVTRGYINPNGTTLGDAADKVAGFLCNKLRLPKQKKVLRRTA
jgi:integrase